MESQQTKPELLTLTDVARSKITEVIASQEQKDLFLRIYVQGGCGGIQYGMAIDSRRQEGDTTYNLDGLDVVIDRISYPYVEGVTVDFDTSGGKSGFRITNPNPEILAAAGSCGGGSCGTGGGCGGGSCGSGGGGCC